MAATRPLPREIVLEVRDRCLCFATQRTARGLARRFDRLFAELGLTNGQFSMMVAMSGMGEAKLGHLAGFMMMDHATLSAAVKKLEKRGLVTLRADENDRRSRRVALTDAGRALIASAVPLWRNEHQRLEAELSRGEAEEIRRRLQKLQGQPDSRPRSRWSGQRGVAR
jgi:DNA-binding MarR family transcriptional regulator